MFGTVNGMRGGEGRQELQSRQGGLFSYKEEPDICHTMGGRARAPTLA